MDWLFLQKLTHAAHLVGMVAWFAGLFYLARLYVYHTECEEQKNAIKENAQNSLLNARIAGYRVMEKRLAYAITTPAMALTLIAGLLSAWISGAFAQPWLHAKLTFVALLVLYHHHLLFIRKKLAVESSSPASPAAPTLKKKMQKNAKSNEKSNENKTANSVSASALPPYSSRFLRAYNEVATLLLIAIVSLAVFRQILPAALSAFLLMGVFFLIFIVVWARRRLK